MDRIDAMQAFVAVADLRGFAPAARKLGLSPSGVTRLVAALAMRDGRIGELEAELAMLKGKAAGATRLA